MNSPEKNNITAVVLAGGRGRRLGGQDKGLLEIDGRPLIEHILELVTPQVTAVIINANRNQPIYSSYGHPVISDNMTDYQGPLAGFAAALSVCNTDYIITLPCDGPFVPGDLVNRLSAAIEENDADLAVAHDGERMQPVYALIPRSLLGSLQDFLDDGDRRSISGMPVIIRHWQIFLMSLILFLISIRKMTGAVSIDREPGHERIISTHGRFLRVERHRQDNPFNTHTAVNGRARAESSCGQACPSHF